jgi:LysM repeat protein
MYQALSMPHITSVGIGAGCMIESVYSNDSQDNNLNNRVQAIFRMPKNIRQVGKSNDVKKIYVEDYVMTFIRQLVGEDYSRCRVAVLVGRYVKTENSRNIFISGAIETERIDMDNEIAFSNDIWTEIYELINKYFSNSEIVGWFLGGPGYLLEDHEKIRKAHINNFAGQDKTLLTFDTIEKEEAFHIYEHNRLSRQDGYYIYYDKNEEMQNYMVDCKNVRSDEMNYDDRITKEIRAVIQSKKQTEEGSGGIGRLMYAAGTLLAIVVLMIGAAMLNNYEQMKNMQSTLNSLTKTLHKTQPGLSKDTLSGVSVNSKNQVKNAGRKEIKQSNGGKDAKENLDVNVLPGNIEALRNAAEQEQLNEKTRMAYSQSSRKKRTSAKAAEKTPQKSKVPGKQVVEKSSSETKPRTGKNAKKTKQYTVVRGDTLIGISFKLYKSANYIKKIMQLNNIKDENFIFEGQHLIVP